MQESNKGRRAPLRHTGWFVLLRLLEEQGSEKFKDSMLKRALYGAAVRGAIFLNAMDKKGGKG